MKSGFLEKKLEEKKESREEIESILFPLIKEELFGYVEYLFNIVNCIQEYLSRNIKTSQPLYTGYVGGRWEERYYENPEIKRITLNRTFIATRKNELKNAKSVKELKENFYWLQRLQFDLFEKYSTNPRVPCIKQIVERKGIDRYNPGELDFDEILN